MLKTRRLIVAITGASGVAFGVRLLEQLNGHPGLETHLMVSASGWLTIDAELDIDRRAVEALATRVHPVKDVGACVASGSFTTDGMVIAPCSMRTLAAVAHGLSDNLITRAADVTLKERRRLVLLTRETPLNLAHLRNMTAVTEMGGVIFPPVPAFYQRPGSIAEMIDQTVGRVLDLFDIRQSLNPPWAGTGGNRIGGEKIGGDKRGAGNDDRA
jgi:4-hydroxy-3-polyprenylbenzoate decarboxylase